MQHELTECHCKLRRVLENNNKIKNTELHDNKLLMKYEKLEIINNNCYWPDFVTG